MKVGLKEVPDMPVKIFATGTRRREKCHQSERMFRPAGRQADRQAHIIPGSRSCWSIRLVDHSRCVSVCV